MKSSARGVYSVHLSGGAADLACCLWVSKDFGFLLSVRNLRLHSQQRPYCIGVGLAGDRALPRR